MLRIISTWENNMTIKFIIFNLTIYKYYLITLHFDILMQHIF